MAAPELLFAPPDGLAIQVQSSISKCAKQLQSQLLANVVVAGGLGAGLSGLPQRVEQEVHASTVLRVPLPSSRTSEFTIHFAGTCCWQRAMGRWINLELAADF